MSLSPIFILHRVLILAHIFLDAHLLGLKCAPSQEHSPELCGPQCRPSDEVDRNVSVSWKTRR